MRDNGGFKAFKWVTLEVGLYALELHAHMREDQLIQLHQPTLNTIRAYATLEQKNEKRQKWNETNQHTLDVYRKKYRNENKDTINAKKKIYKAANREQINAQQRARRAAKRALLLQPDLSVVDEPITPHEE